MTSVAVQLPDDLHGFVEQSVASGAYRNTNELFVSMLANWKEQAESEHSENENRILSTLRSDIALGTAQLDHGDFVKNLDWDAFLAERHRDLETRAANG